MYGSDAIGGVMSFETLNSEFALDSLRKVFNPIVSGNAAIRGTTANNERTGHFNVQLGWNKWAWLEVLAVIGTTIFVRDQNGPDDYVKIIMWMIGRYISIL